MVALLLLPLKKDKIHSYLLVVKITLDRQRHWRMRSEAINRISKDLNCIYDELRAKSRDSHYRYKKRSRNSKREPTN